MTAVWKKPKDERGAVVVEFGFALLFLFLFLVAFFQIAMIFMVHERVSYAAYIGARVNAVRGNVGRAVQVVRGANPLVVGERVKVEERLDVFIDFSNLYNHWDKHVIVSQTFSLPLEKMDTGDNHGPGGHY